MHMSLGQYLRELREKRDLSLREFAKKLKCSAAFVSDIELGRRYPSEKILTDMAKILGTTLEDLKKQDDRLPSEELKRKLASNPGFAAAFRMIADSPVSPEELVALAKRSQKEETRKKKLQ